MFLPDLSHILLTNTPPNPTEAASLERGIADLTSAILHLQGQLRQLEDERRQHRYTLSAIRRIPPEVLGEIFLLTLHFPLNTDGRKRLVNLNRVCRAWRNAALLSHSLWSGLILHPRDVSLHSYGKITEWLSRSGDVPRRLEMYEHWGEEYQGWCSGDADGCHLLRPIVTKLLSSGPSIDRLVLQSKGPECFSRMLKCLNDARQDSRHRPWDSIQSLDIRFANDACWTLGTLTLDRREPMFTTLPPVTSLFLRFPFADDAFDNPLDSSMVHFDISPNALGHLDQFVIACNWEGAHILTALQHCQCLEVLEVDLSFEDLSFRESERPMEARLASAGLLLPKLRTLRLRHQNELDILRYLILPHLDTLDLGFDGHAEKSDLLGDQPRRLKHGLMLREFVYNRSHCQGTLTTLRLYDAAFSPPEIIDILLDFPSLSYLILDKVHLNPRQFWTVLQFMLIQSRYNPTARKCLPCLKVLEFLRVRVAISSAPSLLAAMFEFLLDRGRPYRTMLSFENHTVLNEAWAANIWRHLCHENDVDLEGLGISLDILRPAKLDSDYEREPLSVMLWAHFPSTISRDSD